MIPVFPSEREAKRRLLLEAVNAVRDVLVSGADAAEDLGTLPEAAVEALYESGLLALKLPMELGGAEADLTTQLDVYEAVSRIDSSAGWCVLIGSVSLGQLGAFLSDEGIAMLFVDGRSPKTCAVSMPTGEARPVDGGYVVSGRWSFASGIRHSQWVSARARVTQESNGAPEILSAVIPTSEVTIHDNWHVGGLKGTGSNDFSVSNLYVPEALTLDRQNMQLKRGGPSCRLGSPGHLAVAHAGFALGVARRALDAIIDLAQSKHRGYTTQSSLVMRSSFQRDMGKAELRLRAARALVVEILEAVWLTVSGGDLPTVQMQVEMRSSAAFATEVAVEVVTQAFRSGGGSALFETSILPRCLRDIHAAAQHLMVSEVAYEHQGKVALGLPNIDPLS